MQQSTSVSPYMAVKLQNLIMSLSLCNTVCFCICGGILLRPDKLHGQVNQVVSILFWLEKYNVTSIISIMSHS